MTEIIPTIGRIVLHRGKDGQTRPAIVTHVWGPMCLNLNVFPKDGSDTHAGIKTSVTHADPEQEPGCLDSWHWMPYQKQQAAAGTSIHATTKPVSKNTITAADIDALMTGCKVTDTLLGEKSTVVCLKLANGFEIIESSGCVDVKNYDHAMGVRICMERIRNRLWALEGYRLSCQIDYDRRMAGKV